MRDCDVGDSAYADIVHGVKRLPQWVFARGTVGRVEYETVSTLLQHPSCHLVTSSLDCRDCLQSFVLDARPGRRGAVPEGVVALISCRRRSRRRARFYFRGGLTPSFRGWHVMKAPNGPYKVSRVGSAGRWPCIVWRGCTVPLLGRAACVCA